MWNFVVVRWTVLSCTPVTATSHVKGKIYHVEYIIFLIFVPNFPNISVFLRFVPNLPNISVFLDLFQLPPGASFLHIKQDYRGLITLCKCVDNIYYVYMFFSKSPLLHLITASNQNNLLWHQNFRKNQNSMDQAMAAAEKVWFPDPEWSQQVALLCLLYLYVKHIQ